MRAHSLIDVECRAVELGVPVALRANLVAKIVLEELENEVGR